MMDARQRAIVLPALEVVVDRAAWGQVFGQLCPLAARAQDIHHPVDDRSHVHGSLVAAPLGWRDRPSNQRPFLVGQVARVTQFAAVIATAVLVRPHLAAPSESGSHKGITTDSEDSTSSWIDGVIGVSPR